MTCSSLAIDPLIREPLAKLGVPVFPQRAASLVMCEECQQAFVRIGQTMGASVFHVLLGDGEIVRHRPRRRFAFERINARARVCVCFFPEIRGYALPPLPFLCPSSMWIGSGNLHGHDVFDLPFLCPSSFALPLPFLCGTDLGCTA